MFQNNVMVTNKKQAKQPGQPFEFQKMTPNAASHRK